MALRHGYSQPVVLGSPADTSPWEHGTDMSTNERGKKNPEARRRTIVRLIVILIVVMFAATGILAVPSSAATVPSQTPASTTTVSSDDLPTATDDSDTAAEESFDTSVIDSRNLDAASASSIQVLVNKENPLDPKDYQPEVVTLESVGADSWMSMQPEAAKAMSALLDAAEADGISLEVSSAYRSYSDQKALFNQYVDWYGKKYALTISAKPGYSEHQTGLVADVTTPGGKCELLACFGNTDAGEWVQDNAWKYGYIVRYPEGEEDTTGFAYEPWHLRYVGKGVATQMWNADYATFEEYLGVDAAPSY